MDSQIKTINSKQDIKKGEKIKSCTAKYNKSMASKGPPSLPGVCLSIDPRFSPRHCQMCTPQNETSEEEIFQILL